MTEKFDRPRRARLHITTAPDGMPSIRLNDMELSGLIYSEGTSILPGDEWDNWKVTLAFGAGGENSALDLDFDIEVLERLLAEKKASGAEVESA